MLVDRTRVAGSQNCRSKFWSTAGRSEQTRGRGTWMCRAIPAASTNYRSEGIQLSPEALDIKGFFVSNTSQEIQ